jgi:branched-chain amino acid transport system permease protein
VSVDVTPAKTTPKRKLHLTWVDSFLWVIRIGAVLVITLGLIGSISGFLAGEGPTAAAWRDLIVAGLSFGAMYGLIALGYSMVYGVLGFINFAHGEVFMSGAFLGYFAATFLAGRGMYETNPMLALFLALLTAVLTSTTVAVVVERLIPLITSIGVSFFLQYTFLGLFGERSRTYPQLPSALTGTVTILGLPIRTINLVVITVAAVAMASLWFFVTRTKTGRAMRAVAEDKEIAALMGINVDRTIVTTFAVGGAMAGVAGMLYGQLYGVQAFMGFIPGIKAFTSAVLGGIGSIPGAMVGGVLLGLFEGVGPQLILDGLGIPSPSQLRDVVAFSALVLMLVFRPSGLFGERLGSEDRA